jgi:2-keto-4-pentenoate hydratase
MNTTTDTLLSDDQMIALANALAEARLRGHSVATPALEFSVSRAYDVQEQFNAMLGSDAVGWKVGSTSAEAQARLGTDEPGAGRILRRFAFGNDANVPICAAHDTQVEVEFAFRVARPLIPRDAPYEVGDVRAALGGFVPGLEIVGSRFTSGLLGAGRALVTADGGANIAFVGGVEQPLPDVWAFADAPCELRINGGVVAEGTGARALGDPLNVLVWLANHLSGRGLTLEAGSVVTTGTCTGLEYIQSGDELVGDFGALGQVRATMVALEP